jgi:diadenosine tetraphosphatase ApaH/serine/threonine PP2A family protein phosphatase
MSVIERYLINLGSVGQPRGDNPKAAWLRLDTDTGSIEFRRVGYDIDRAQEIILEAQLPSQLADRLEVGR